MYRTILDGRQGTGAFCIIPTAGATPETAHAPDVIAQLKACSGFFFIGGVQSRVTAAFRPDGRSTPALETIMQRWREGAVVWGSSAGAAIMSDPMIAGGTSAGAFTRGFIRLDGAEADDESTAGMVLGRGLGFFPPALADQHFLARGRVGRLLIALLDVSTFDRGYFFVASMRSANRRKVRWSGRCQTAASCSVRGAISAPCVQLVQGCRERRPVSA